MKTLMMLNIFFSIIVFSSFVGWASEWPKLMESPAKTVLYIHNQNQRDLVLIIKSKGTERSFLSEQKDTFHANNFKDGWGIASVPAQAIIQMEIPEDELAESSLFSISGETDMFMSRGVCELPAGKSYLLTFTQCSSGTQCVHEEVSCCPYPEEQNVKKVNYDKSHPFTVLNNINALFHPSLDVVACS